MRCPTCEAPLADDARECSRCGTGINARARRAYETQKDRPFDPLADARNPLGVIAFRCAVVALVPFVGLLAGPLAVLLGLVSWIRGKEHRLKGNVGPTHGALVLGTLTTLTNWLGLLMMLHG
jgi:hypothetical protein